MTGFISVSCLENILFLDPMTMADNWLFNLNLIFNHPVIIF